MAILLAVLCFSESIIAAMTLARTTVSSAKSRRHVEGVALIFHGGAHGEFERLRKAVDKQRNSVQDERTCSCLIWT